jgi:hypothetical protein
MQRILTALMLSCAVAWLPACGSSNSTPVTPTPSTVNVAGTWAANVAAVGTSARMTWTLSQSNTTVTGPVLLSLSTGIVLMNGFLTGTVSGTTLTYTISVGPGGIPLQPACAGQIGGTMAIVIGTVSTLTGTPAVTSSSCPVPLPAGSITLTKQ